MKVLTSAAVKAIGPYAWPGGYPLYFMDTASNVLCFECASKADDYSEPVIAHDVNWEDTSLYCGDCSKRIESAYAEWDDPIQPIAPISID